MTLVTQNPVEALGIHAGASLEVQQPKHDPQVQYIEWYSQGQARSIIVEGHEILVRFVGRKGRKARIAIVAPPGAQFDNMPPPIIHGPH